MPVSLVFLDDVAHLHMSHLHFCKVELCCAGLWIIEKMETYFISANYLLKKTLKSYTYCGPDLLKVVLFIFVFIHCCDQ